MKAVKAAERILGPDDPVTANIQNSLGVLYAERGKHAEAEDLLRRALTTHERRLGPNHPNLAQYRLNLGALHLKTGASAKAIAEHARAAEIQEKSLTLVLAGGSEAQKRAYANKLRADTDGLVSLHTVSAPSSNEAARLALETVLRRKGRVLDALADHSRALRREGSSGAAFEALRKKRAELARLVFGISAPSAAERSTQTRLEAEVDRLEAQLARESAEFRATSAPVTLASVAAALPEHSLLVEIVSYRPINPAEASDQGFQPARYVAYVLDHRSEIRWVELGPAATIDAAVTELRKALASKSPEVRARARALDQLVMEPIRRLLGGAEVIFLSPDGALNLVPFAALVDESGRYLVERFTFGYLTSGRDLLRRAARRQARSEPVIVANPDFGDPSAARGASGALGSAVFWPLPGTAEEGRALGRLLPGARMLTDKDVTAARLTELHGPRVLHVATHGFFLSDGDGSPTAASPASKRSFDLEERARIDNPLLRSGLVLANANLRRKGAEQGILTALEASGLDLHGTQLVVLSACETGLGDVEQGEGVYGLRRALVIAGAETQVMSLWKVDDAATRDLMVAYYEALEGGGERAASMRAVQRAMLASKATEHPFYWASFIVSGDPAAYDGTLAVRPPPSAPRPGAPVEPSARGCGCDLTSPASHGPASWAFLLASLALLARARRPTRSS